MQNSMMVFAFALLGKFGSKNQNCQFKLKFCTKTNSNVQNSILVLTFGVLEQKYPFCANLVEKIKIARLSSNLVPIISFIIFWDFWMF